MTLYIIGIGLNDVKDITVKGLEAVKLCDIIYLENYTSLLQCSFEDLEQFYGKKLILSDRNQSEQGSIKIIKQAKDKNVAFLVVGDSLGATTHIEIFKEAKEANVEVKIIHNASVLTAVGVVGLQLYNYGKTASVPYLDDFPELETPYNILENNQKYGMHTLFLLDIKVPKDRFMTVGEGLFVLEDIEKRKGKKLISDETFVIGCARLGANDQLIKSGKLKDIKGIDFGAPPHCLIIPGKMHFLEEEMVELWRK
jgi:diphthine methyl ester synthase